MDDPIDGRGLGTFEGIRVVNSVTVIESFLNVVSPQSICKRQSQEALKLTQMTNIPNSPCKPHPPVV